MGLMETNIAMAEVMIFAVAVHEAVNDTKPTMPSVVIMEVASKVDFASDTLAEDVRVLVNTLVTEEKCQSSTEFVGPGEKRRPIMGRKSLGAHH